MSRELICECRHKSKALILFLGQGQGEGRHLHKGCNPAEQELHERVRPVQPPGAFQGRVYEQTQDLFKVGFINIPGQYNLQELFKVEYMNRSGSS